MRNYEPRHAKPKLRFLKCRKNRGSPDSPIPRAPGSPIPRNSIPGIPEIRGALPRGEFPYGNPPMIERWYGAF